MKIAKKRVDKGLWWDRAWSLVEGCTPVSEGCDHCWSAAQTHLRSGQKNPAIKKRYTFLTMKDLRHKKGTPTFTGEIRLMWESLKLPTENQKPTVWAVWNDLFHEDVPIAFTISAFRQMLLCPQHTFIVCTKRPQVLKNGMSLVWAVLKTEYPKAQIPLPNVIGMVSVESQDWADIRIIDLLRAPFAVRAINVEPMLGRVDLAIHDKEEFYTPAKEWVCCGAETGPQARKINYEDARFLLNQCREFGIPFWMKAGNKGEELPEDLKVRELPEIH